jgi:hypothetical protein
MGMSNKMKSEMTVKSEAVKTILAGFETEAVVEVTGDGSFAMIVEVDGEKRVLNFVGTMKKNTVEGVAATADEVLDALVTEFMDKVDEREKTEKVAAEKKALKEADAAAKKAMKEKEKEAKANKANKAVTGEE